MAVESSPSGPFSAADGRVHRARAFRQRCRCLRTTCPTSSPSAADARVQRAPLRPQRCRCPRTPSPASSAAGSAPASIAYPPPFLHAHAPATLAHSVLGSRGSLVHAGPLHPGLEGKALCRLSRRSPRAGGSSSHRGRRLPGGSVSVRLRERFFRSKRHTPLTLPRLLATSRGTLDGNLRCCPTRSDSSRRPSEKNEKSTPR